MLTGEFTEEYEIFVFQQATEAVGHTVDVVCPDKKAGERIKTSLHDFEGDQTYTEKPGHLFTQINKSFADVDARRVMTPSTAPAAAAPNISAPTSACRRWCGISTRPRSRSSPSATVSRSWSRSMAWCRGKKVGALGACEPEVTLAGGTYVDLSPTEALVDGTMVSAKGWTALAAFMRECLAVLGTEIRHGEDAGDRRPEAQAAARPRTSSRRSPSSPRAIALRVASAA